MRIFLPQANLSHRIAALTALFLFIFLNRCFLLYSSIHFLRRFFHGWYLTKWFCLYIISCGRAVSSFMTHLTIHFSLQYDTFLIDAKPYAVDLYKPTSLEE